MSQCGDRKYMWAWQHYITEPWIGEQIEDKTFIIIGPLYISASGRIGI